MRRQEKITIIAIILILVIVKLAGFKILIVMTNSMEPTIEPGSVVITAPTWIDKPEVGKVILYHIYINGDRYNIIHRAIGEFQKNGTVYFVTKGDNRPFPDLWFVPESQIDGVMLFAIPKLGNLFFFPYTHYYAYVVIVSLIVMFFGTSYILEEFRRIELQFSVKARRRERETLRVLRKKKLSRVRR